MTGLAGGVVNLLDSHMFGEAKLKFGILAEVAEYELYLKDYGRDEGVVSAVDQIGLQNSFSIKF